MPRQSLASRKGTGAATSRCLNHQEQHEQNKGASLRACGRSLALLVAHCSLLIARYRVAFGGGLTMNVAEPCRAFVPLSCKTKAHGPTSALVFSDFGISVCWIVP